MNPELRKSSLSSSKLRISEPRTQNSEKIMDNKIKRIITKQQKPEELIIRSRSSRTRRNQKPASSSDNRRSSEEEEQKRRAARDIHPRRSVAFDVKPGRGAVVRSGSEIQRRR
ncbi:uncharacterized protein DS421_20g707200 [Arachis hypogaea]|nr:uncharacterized protein DS421_20g707200 [Arachis hypogaea]